MPVILICTAIIARVYSSLLDSNECWCAQNSTICGQVPKNSHRAGFVVRVPSEIWSISLEDLQEEMAGKI